VRIERAELYELTLPLLEPFIISGGAVTERRSLVVALSDDQGHTGYGESPPFDLPFYSEETLASARDVIERVLLPRLAGRAFDSPAAVDDALSENVRGNQFARAGVETAAWDLEAHARGTGLAQLVAARLGVEPAASVACGVALGTARPPRWRGACPRRWSGGTVASKSRSPPVGTTSRSARRATPWRTSTCP